MQNIGENINLEISEIDLKKKISDLLDRDSSKFSQFNSIYDAFKSSIVSAQEFLSVFIDLSLSNVPNHLKKDVIREFGKAWTKLADMTTITIHKKNKKKGVRMDLSDSGNAGNQDMLKAWNNFKVKNSNEITPWESVGSSYASNAHASNVSSSGARVLVLSKTAIPSKQIQSLPSNWANKLNSPIQENSQSNTKDFPSLPASTSRKTVSSVSVREEEPKEEISFKKKGKKKVLLHFG